MTSTVPIDWPISKEKAIQNKDIAYAPKADLTAAETRYAKEFYGRNESPNKKKNRELIS
jgi:hypothetical protein